MAASVMTRWLFALPAALAVTGLLVFALGWLVGRSGAAPERAHTTMAANEAETAARPRRPEIPVRHVYPVPVWDLGAEPGRAPSFEPRTEILARAWPGLPGVVSVSCTVRLVAGEGGLRIEPVACPAKRLETLSALLAPGLEAIGPHENAPRLVELTARFEVEPEEAG